MKCSHNELAALAEKVARARGYSYGIAHDLGRAAAWLAAQGYDGIGAVMATVPLAPRSAVEIDCQLVLDKGSAGSHGAAVIDLLVAETIAGPLVVRQLDAPLLLIGLAAIAAGDHGAQFVVGLPGGGEIALDHAGCAPRLVDDLTEFTIMCPSARSNQPDVARRPGDIEIDDDTWHAARKIAAETYVPASEQSRLSGAGAGLTDND